MGSIEAQPRHNVWVRAHENSACLPIERPLIGELSSYQELASAKITVNADGEKVTHSWPMESDEETLDLEELMRRILEVCLRPACASARSCGGYPFDFWVSVTLSNIKGCGLRDRPELKCLREDISFFFRFPWRDEPVERGLGAEAHEHKPYSISELKARITAKLSHIETFEIRPWFRPV